MIADRIRAACMRLRPSGTRADLAVSAYCHAFRVEPPAVADGGAVEDGSGR